MKLLFALVAVLRSGTDVFFEKTSLSSQGMVVQLGHSGARCPNPSPTPTEFIVVDLNGIHYVYVRFCDCGFFSDSNPRRTQLLRVGWYPATPEKPASAITFDALRFFHVHTWQAKTSFYDFFQTLARRIDNSGVSDHPVSFLFESIFTRDDVSM